MSLRVPLEVIDLIIDEVSLLGKGIAIPALQACALTCRDFVPSSQRGIFYSVRLEESRSLSLGNKPSLIKGLPQLLDALKLSPKLACYVKELRMYEISSVVAFDTDPNLSNLLCMLQSLTTFRVSFKSSSPADWQTISSNSRHVLVNIFLLPSLRSLSLCNMNLPSISAKWIMDVENVEITGVIFSPDWNNLYIPGRTEEWVARCCRLKAISIGWQEISATQPIFDILSSKKCEPKKLIVKSHDVDNIVVAQEIIQRTHAFLDTFEFIYSNIYHDKENGPEFNLALLKNIRTFKMVLICGDSRIQKISRILSTLPAQNEVQKIIIEVVPAIISDLLGSSNEKHWKHLDNLLSCSLFTKLQNVIIAFEPNGGLPWMKTRIYPFYSGNLKRIRYFLPGINRKGKLQLHFTSL
ncbi:hypothetical protein BDQ17DRAFT_341436 [Cyathus striatus]|nr:hypothetical protein BDQ17DRAFT_341436 [Cyathus striatus]